MNKPKSVSDPQRRADDVRLAAINASSFIDRLIDRIRRCQHAGDVDVIDRLPPLVSLFGARNDARQLAEDLRRQPVTR